MNSLTRNYVFPCCTSVGMYYACTQLCQLYGSYQLAILPSYTLPILIHMFLYWINRLNHFTLVHERAFFRRTCRSLFCGSSMSLYYLNQRSSPHADDITNTYVGVSDQCKMYMDAYFWRTRLFFESSMTLYILISPHFHIHAHTYVCT